MQFARFLGGVIQQSQRAVRSLEKSVQEVVEVLQPGPLGSTAARWDSQRRADADAAVQQAMQNWQALQQELEHSKLEQQLLHQQHLQMLEYEQQFMEEQQHEQECEQQYEQNWQDVAEHSSSTAVGSAGHSQQLGSHVASSDASGPRC